MTKTEVTTDILVPEREFVAEYTVHNPAKLLGVILEMMKKVWRVSSSKVYTDKIKWDVTGEKVDFYGEWRNRDAKDQYTVIWTRIIAQGTQDPKTKEGTIILKVKSMMKTTFESATPIDQALKSIYMKSVYKDQLMQYISIAKKRINDFDVDIRELYGMEERAAGSLPGSKM